MIAQKGLPAHDDGMPPPGGVISMAESCKRILPFGRGAVVKA